MSKLISKKKKIREKIKKQSKLRLTVYKSNKHIYTQIFTPDGSVVITSMSTLNNEFKSHIKEYKTKAFNKTEKAKIVGKLLVKKMNEKNINNVVFDRSGLKFHGRIKIIADTVKKFGIKC